MLVRQIWRKPRPDHGRGLCAARAVFPSASIRRAGTQRK
jgi:hypothetical protein